VERRSLACFGVHIIHPPPNQMFEKWKKKTNTFSTFVFFRLGGMASDLGMGFQSPLGISVARMSLSKKPKPYPRRYPLRYTDFLCKKSVGKLG
jgi:hypothetical protein